MISGFLIMSGIVSGGDSGLRSGKGIVRSSGPRSGASATTGGRLPAAAGSAAQSGLGSGLTQLPQSELGSQLAADLRSQVFYLEIL
jgi:hypothetical protein